jgi:hypothetical protein
MKTSELTGAALDWAVAKCEVGDAAEQAGDWWKPSTDWAQGGPIIEREQFNRIALNVSGGYTVSKKIAELHDDNDSFIIRWVHGVGPTPLIAAMRCYVASKLGDTVDIPEELL